MKSPAFLFPAGPLPWLCLVLFLARPVHAAGPVDQEFVNRLGGSLMQVNGDYAIAQTFTVGQSGFLDRVEVQAGRDDAVPQAPAIVEIRRTSGGVPNTSDAAVLARVIVPASQVPQSVFASSMFGVDLGEQAVAVSAGDLLAVSLRSDARPDRSYHWVVTELNRYPRGEAYIRSPFTNGAFIRITDADPSNSEGLDLGFRTFVTVPEPGAVSVIAAAGMLMLRRRTGRR